MNRAPELRRELSTFLDSFPYPDKYIKGDAFTILDIMVASHLYGIYTLIDFYVPKTVHSYLQKVKEICQFNYHSDFRADEDFKHWVE